MDVITDYKTPKGTKDSLPSEMYKKEKIIRTALSIVKECGAQPIDTPAFEIRNLILNGDIGEDNTKLVYDLKDNYSQSTTLDTVDETDIQESEDLGEVYSLRYDQTVSFKRFIKSNGISKMKRLQIGKVWRRDQPNFQCGRFREFTQFDFDIYGDDFDSLAADVETLVIVCRILSALNIEYVVRINDRQILEQICGRCGVDSNLFSTVCSSIDKLDKLKPKAIVEELIEKGLVREVAETLMNTIRTVKLDDLATENLNVDLKDTFNLTAKLLNIYNISPAVIKFDPSLARGLGYYTGIIFEIVLKKKKSKIGSIAGGGRYDKLCGGKCIGFSLGIDRLACILPDINMKKETSPTVWVVQPGNDEKTFLRERMEIVARYRSAGVYADTELRESTGIKLQMKFALKNEVPFVVFIGESEVENSVVSLKDLEARTQTTMTFEESLEIIKSK